MNSNDQEPKKVRKIKRKLTKEMVNKLQKGKTQTDQITAEREILKESPSNVSEESETNMKKPIEAKNLKNHGWQTLRGNIRRKSTKSGTEIPRKYSLRRIINQNIKPNNLFTIPIPYIKNSLSSLDNNKKNESENTGNFVNNAGINLICLRNKYNLFNTELLKSLDSPDDSYIEQYSKKKKYILKKIYN